MKRKLIASIISFVMLATPVTAGVKEAVNWTYKNLYAETMIITGISAMDNGMELITCRNANGYKYSFWSDSGDWYIGDMVSCVMYTRGTPLVRDDRILAAKYSRPDMLAAQGKSEYFRVREIIPFDSETDEVFVVNAEGKELAYYADVCTVMVGDVILVTLSDGRIIAAESRYGN